MYAVFCAPIILRLALAHPACRVKEHLLTKILAQNVAERLNLINHVESRLADASSNTKMLFERILIDDLINLLNCARGAAH